MDKPTIEDLGKMTTDRLECHWLVTYSVLLPGHLGAVDQRVQTGPTMSGPYTDFEDIRNILALRRSIRPEVILITSMRLDDER